MTADSLVLVPLEATTVMVNAGTDAIQNEGNAFIATRKGYRAIIAMLEGR